jgi:2-(3-amino-3-carboxypropyl)histidine synthase
MKHNIQLKELLSEVKKRNPELVLLQIPEGLKTNTVELENAFEKEGISTITLLDPCFGACDIADYKAKLLGCDLLVHFGHSKMLSSELNVIYWPVEFGLEEKSVQEFAQTLQTNSFFQKNKKMGLYATIQFHSHLKEIKEALEKAGFDVFIGKGDLKNGQILGCDVSARKEIEQDVNANLFFGDGYFHSLAIAFASNKPTFQYNPFTNKLENLKTYKEKFLRQRFGQIALAKKAQAFGIILCTKRGQLRKAKAFRLKEILEEAGKKVYLVSMDYVSPEALLGVNVDPFVNTACSRIATDDFEQYSKPMLTPVEAEILAGKRKIENYVFDEIKHLGTKVL